MPWDNLFSATEINPSGEVEGVKEKKKKKACDCWQRIPTFSGQICLVYFFASYFNKGAQWVYQTALMKGLLAGLPAADPLDPECVFTINPPLCLQQATSSAPPPPCCLNPLPSHTNGHIYRSEPQTPPTPLPQNLSSITPQVLHTYATVHTHSQHTALAYIQFIILWTCICAHVYTLIPNSLHLQDHTDKVYMYLHTLCTYTHATQECVSTHSYIGRNACTYTHTLVTPIGTRLHANMCILEQQTHECLLDEQLNTQPEAENT